MTSDPLQLDLSPLQAQHILRLAGGRSAATPPTVTTVRNHNHVFRLEAGGEAFYLKTHTKHWYAGDPEAPGNCVAHEQSAWAVLRARGLPVPDVLLARRDGDNPLGRPFLLTQALTGSPLTVSLARTADSRMLGEMLSRVGDYLRRMHAIAFAYPGYIMSPQGPSRPPRPNAWQHRCWTPEARQQHALATIDVHSAELPPPLVDQLRAILSRTAETLSAACDPPRFTHGDCHAHQLFLAREGGAWRVTGVVDMEVASAGDPVEDLIKFAIEFATFLPAEARWWKPLFQGYGREPDFDAFRLRLLGASPAECSWMRPVDQRRRWRAVLGHMLRATRWEELLADGW